MPLSEKDNSIAKQVCISVFAIFLGSQITEGVLLVPYWQSLSSEAFYSYYETFGPIIGRFYTILTIIAAAIPIIIASRYLLKRSEKVNYALVSAIFAILFVLSFYVYFKDVNESFYNRSFSENELNKELTVWSYWHWSRVVLEIISLVFLMMAFKKSQVVRS